MSRRADRERSGEYRVERPRSYVWTEQRPAAPAAPEAAAAAGPRPLAVVVSHGMGQQIPFQTLDQVAQGIRREDARVRGIDPAQLPKPEARTVLLGDQTVQRLEFKLKQADGGEREVHLYEAYWAWLTEGQVTLRNVLSFLWRAGVGGIRNGLHPFQRWLFGDLRSFQPPVRTVVYLLVGLAASLSLVGLNLAVVTVVAARSPFDGEPPAWLSDGLFGDLTTTLNLLLATAFAFGLLLGLSWLSRRLRWSQSARRWFARVAALFFYVVLVAIVLAAVAVGMLLWIHGTCDDQPGGGDRQVWKEVLDGRFVDRVNLAVETFLVLLVAFALTCFLVAWVWRFGRRVVHALAARQRGNWWTATVVAGLGLLTFLVAAELWLFAAKVCSAGPGGMLALVRGGVAWPLLVTVSALVRSLLVQFVGDVAAYINPHTLNRFGELRTRIRQQVCAIAEQIYGAAAADGSGWLYDGVAVVGHSLGSVVVYDCLNRLINDDDLAQSTGEPGGAGAPGRGKHGEGRPRFVDAARRTRLLLTFGSPLDKVAFLFTLQGEKTSAAREALAGSVQPLIADPAKRSFPWINVWTPTDIFSGRLDYYDLPEDAGAQADAAGARPVDNQRDDEATTLLLAHTEYWENPLIFRLLHAGLTGAG